MNTIESLEEFYPEESWLTADGFDKAIIGVYENKVVYSINKCVKILMKDMSEEDAIEYLYFNTIGAYVGEKTPIFVEDSFIEERS